MPLSLDGKLIEQVRKILSLRYDESGLLPNTRSVSHELYVLAALLSEWDAEQVSKGDK